MPSTSERYLPWVWDYADDAHIDIFNQNRTTKTSHQMFSREKKEVYFKKSHHSGNDLNPKRKLWSSRTKSISIRRTVACINDAE